jgi:hypothetical protein
MALAELMTGAEPAAGQTLGRRRDPSAYTADVSLSEVPA